MLVGCALRVYVHCASMQVIIVFIMLGLLCKQLALPAQILNST
jgi:hypothetical protein